MNAVGIFAYNFGNGIEFTIEQQLPEEFRNVKKHSKLYLENNYHKVKVATITYGIVEPPPDLQFFAVVFPPPP